MSIKVWKYPLSLTVAPQRIQMPGDSAVLHVHMQDEFPTLWALVDPDHSTCERTFVVVGTGWTVPDTAFGQYVGTAHDGPFVWHVFEDVA